MTPPSMKHDAVAHGAGKGHLVRHDDHRHVLVGKRADHAQHLAGQKRIERGGRLVEKEDFRLHRQRAGDGHALLLPAGELIGVGVFLAF